MPEPLKQHEVENKQDPSVAKQLDRETPMDQQFQEFYNAVDSIKTSMMGTYREGTGPVSRPMAVGKRVGPDFLFIANNHSRKFKDFEKNKEVELNFGSSNDWISVSGEVTTTSNSDPRIKEIYSPFIKAWFGDLGDGTHTGNYTDPRMSIIEVKSKYICHWAQTKGKLGLIKDVAVGAVTGQVANPTSQREMTEKDIEQARTMANQSTSSS